MPTKIPPSEYETISSLYFDRKKSQPEIAKIYDCSHAYIGKILKQHDSRACRIAGGKFTPEQHQARCCKVVEDIGNGKARAQIAIELGISVASLAEFIARNNINVSVELPKSPPEPEVITSNLDYVKSALLVADHGECGCTACELALKVLLTPVSPEISKIASIASDAIRELHNRTQSACWAGTMPDPPRQSHLAADLDKAKLVQPEVDPNIGKLFGLWKVIKRVWVDVRDKTYSEDKHSIDRGYRDNRKHYECQCQGCQRIQAVMSFKLTTNRSKQCRLCHLRSLHVAAKKERSDKMRSAPRPGIKISKLDIISLRESGQTLQEIAERAGVTRERIRQIVGGAKKGGCKTVEETIELYHSNLTIEQVASKQGFSAQTIANRWARSGLSIFDRNGGCERSRPEETYTLWRVIQRVWVDASTKEYSSIRSSIPPSNRKKEVYYECECQGCGSIKPVQKQNLVNHVSRSCHKCSIKLRDTRRKNETP